MLGNRNSQHTFATIPSVNMARSQFDRSFTIKDTIFFDFLTPIFCDEILPGDTANVAAHIFARLATQIVPIMDNLYLDFFYFFVPNRLVWDNWEKFNGAQDNPGDSTDYLIPQITAPMAGFENGSLFDHFGIPTQVAGIKVNALPFRAYNLIYNEWFRDQNMENSIVVPKDDGPDVYTDYFTKLRNKRHDYFTSCLPWPQKGPAVELPLGSFAPVVSTSVPPTITGSGFTNSVVISPTGTATLAHNATATASDPWSWGTTTGLQTDLTNATAATINQLREAFAMQSLFELDARGGTRYVEILLAHFNVQSPDFRLQRPEYLGGGTININSHPVVQTSASLTGDSPQGTLTAFGTASSQGKMGLGFTKSFVEHGYVIGMICPRADITYQQGLNKMWSRQTRFDFFWPKLQELGEQAVLNEEIYAQGTSADQDVFGYQERYAEYRYMPSSIRGQFRSNYSDSLDVWHMAQEFGSLPTLNSTFIQQNTPIDRSLAVGAFAPDLILDGWFQYKHARPMMTYSVPSNLGRF